ncbi:V-set and immunoglobulin domain-containing protein 2-like [Mastacembelus armatus]|uniref:V-set and immunoglobulin domain-containing protein 2-like n=1 Tax=Mastacembelus armatus TaxID=205130 RepID=A0A3Q3MEK3_9TELE|nr:V-set and immunoglobulin domain-containing protein 2-like [Mastacembelus armatus]
MILWSFMVLLAGLDPAAVAQTVISSDPVCAVEGSTVTLPCTFTPRRSFIRNGREVPLQIIRVRWCVNHLVCQGSTPSVYDSDSQTNDPRYQYLGDLTGNCTLQIRDVQRKDNTAFRFRMEADNVEGHFTNQTGANVTVVDRPDLRIISSTGQRSVTLGHTVTLQCTSVCTFHQLTVTWFRDDHALSETGPALLLGPLEAKDSGNYTCGLKTAAGQRSPPYSLQVETPQGDTKVPLIVGVVFGVLLLLGVLVFFIVRRNRAAAAAADKDQRKDLQQTHPDKIGSNILPEQEGGGQQQMPGEVENDVSYSSVQFKHKEQSRAVQEAEDAVIYSSVVNRG